MLSRAQNTFHHNPRLRGPVSSSIRKIIIRVTSSKRYQNVRSDLTILGPFANVTLTLCVSWEAPYTCVYLA